MKIGIYGGSFNPIHRGHINIIKYVLEEKKLDKMIVIPVGIPSHRDDFSVSGSERLHMVEAACMGVPRAEVSDIEIKAKGKSYTYDTLLKLKKKYPDGEFYEIIGEDSADYLHKWKDYKKLVEKVKFIVLKRSGFEYTPNHKNIEVLESPIYPYSSTKVRKAVRKGKDISSMVPKGVEELIRKYHLYEGSEV